MRYKSRVLSEYPDARLATLDYHDDGAPYYRRVVAGPEGETIIMDIHDGRGTQGSTAAWRSAYYWMVRVNNCLNPKARDAGWGVAFCNCPICVGRRDNARLAPDPSRAVGG